MWKKQISQYVDRKERKNFVIFSSLDFFLIFGEECIIKTKFHVYEKSINIDKVEIKRIVLSNKESYGKQVHINILLDLYIQTMPFHRHYA